jgi:hypothetical protein
MRYAHIIGQGLSACLLSVPCPAADEKPIQPAAEVSEPGHGLGKVTGTGIDMKVLDHAVAGEINGAVAWGYFDEASNASRLVMRKYGQTISAEFKRGADKSLGGVITSGEGQSKRTTTVAFSGADPKAGNFTLTINGKPVVVSIASEGKSGAHFINPTYSTEIDGKPVSYRIDATGCMKYSLNMGMLILGAYAH